MAACDTGGVTSVPSAPVSASTLSGRSPDLVAHYNFDEGTGAVLHDSSGYGNNGAIHSASWSGTGTSGGSLVFDGATSYVEIPGSDSLSFSTGMTLEAWVNPAAVSGGEVIQQRSSRTDCFSLWSSWSGPLGELYPQCPVWASGVAVVQSLTPLSYNTWTHLAMTYDGAALRLFINGVQVDSHPLEGTIDNGTDPNGAYPTYIGGNPMPLGPQDRSSDFNGMIDEVRIYNRALSQTEIQNDMLGPPIIGISLSPASATLGPLQTQQFTAAVTNASNTGVTWSLNPNIGTIGGTGLYTAPASVTSQQMVTVTATSVADTSKGASAMVTLNPAPTLASVGPTSGVQGTSVPVTLTGTNFILGATVTTNNPGIAVNALTVVSATRITATFTIAANATLGGANVTVTTSGGTSAPAIFTVNPPPPTLSTIAPATGVRGAGAPVTLTGTNFVSGATVATNNTGIAVSAVTVVSTTQITATFTIAANATLGAANVTVTTSGGTSAPVVFTVNPPPPTLSTIAAATGVRGAAIPVTLTGTNFVAGATAATNNTGIAVSAVTVVSTTQITATFTIAANATLGAANVTVTTSAGTSAPVVFTVKPPPPTLSTITPAYGAPGAAVPVTLTGTNFVAGATVLTSNSGIAVSAVTVVSTTQITATFTIAANAPTGVTRVAVATSAGASAPGLFLIGPPPTLSTIAPATGVQGTSVPVTLTGTNFVAGATVLTNNTGIGVSAVTVVSATQITATFTIAANAPLGGANVKVTTSTGTSAPVVFTVNAP